MDSAQHQSQHHKVTHRLFHHRPFRNALILLATLSIFLGILIVPVESRDPKAVIHSVEEGIWWAFTTVTGVGYGDFVPVTTTGRLIGIALEITGVIFFGLIIGIIGITMTKRQEEFVWFRLFDRLDHIDAKLQRMEHQNAANVQQTLSEHDEKRTENK
ncbi:MAG: potassium channel family protein [Patescibacteria group bacterium]